MICKKNTQHRYGNHLKSCPWCEREARFQLPAQAQQHISPPTLPQTPVSPPLAMGSPAQNNKTSPGLSNLHLNEPWASLVCNGLASLFLGFLLSADKSSSVKGMTALVAVISALVATGFFSSFRIGSQSKNITTAIFLETTFCMAVSFGCSFTTAMAGEAGERSGVAEAVAAVAVYLTIGLIILIPVSLVAGVILSAVVTVIRSALKV